ncbi:MAG: hypothetical protein GY711_19615 [bacterium]|nr:hypothetical protein [bacterium]
MMSLARVVRTAAGWLVVLGLFGTAGGCCVTPPNLDEVRDFGFETPGQAFRSFRTGVRADSFDLEYRCFSSGWKRRNGAGIQAYLEFRDELIAQNRFLRLGLAKLELRHIEFLAPDRAILVTEAFGQTVTFLLVREEYWELEVPGQKKRDGATNLLADQVIVADPQAEGRFWGRVDVDDPTAVTRFSRLAFGREWKIDDFAVADASDNP